MKGLKNKVNRKFTSIINDKLIPDTVDTEKLSRFGDEISIGINNYILYQKFFYYKWPCWIQNGIENSDANTITSPVQLLNNKKRNWISFSNPLSTEKIYIDPSGMISPSYDNWSIEFWIYNDDHIFRPQEMTDKISQYRDIKTSIITTKWKEKNFTLTEKIYGIKTNIEEAIIDIKCSSKISKTKMLIVIRPYNIFKISGIRSLTIDKDKKIISINKQDRLITEKRPDSVIYGNALEGDIDINMFNDDKVASKCKYNMATLALAFDLKKGDNEFKFRMDLSNKGKLKQAKIDYTEGKKNFIEYSRIKKKNGCRIKFPDKRIENWFYGSKISALNHYKNEIVVPAEWYNHDIKSIYYITSGYNRMGYHSESFKIIDKIISGFNVKRKTTFSARIDNCYLILAISDYFIISRDIDYIKSKFKLISDIAFALLRDSKQIKKEELNYRDRKNSIENFIILENNISDVILLAYALYQYSYLARCLGIFNNEIQFDKESKRLEGLILKNLSKYTDEEAEDEEKKDKEDETEIIAEPKRVDEPNEFFIYKVMAGYPFSMSSLPFEIHSDIIEQIFEKFKEIPLSQKSIGGVDTLFSIIFAINLLLVKDSRSYIYLDKLMEFGGDRYVLPDIINSKNGSGLMGTGDSAVAISSFFTLIRYFIFIDIGDNLEIFPIPVKEWFNADSEIIIEDAPSKYGLINLEVKSSGNEVIFTFPKIPQYIPPSITINLPFKTKIKLEDDFILKNKAGNSYIINGWPSKIRFTKK